MAQMRHSGGIVDAVLELGFEAVKYFEGDITASAVTISLPTTPARRIVLKNKSETDDVYLRIDGNTAVANVGITPGDNIKIGPGCSFTMDMDIIETVSMITTGPTVPVEGLLGFKAITGC